MSAPEIRQPISPLFVVGFPRSGTTLLQALICTQKGFASFPEIHYFDICTRNISAYHPINLEGYRHVRQLFERFAQFPLKPEFWKNRKKDLLKGAISKKKLYFEIIEAYSSEYMGNMNAPEYWVDKTPDQFQHLDEIHNLFPESKMIAIIRHPLDTIYSCALNLPGYEKIDSKIIARNWIRMSEKVMEFKKKHPEKFFIVRYEALSSSTESTMKDIFNFLGISLDPDRLQDFSMVAKAYISNNEPWKKAVLSTRIKTYSGRFKKDYSKREIAELEILLGFWMARFDYPLTSLWIYRRLIRLLKAFKKTFSK